MSTRWALSIVRIVSVFIIALLALPASAQLAGKRAAVVIGNQDYVRAPLASPYNDARLIAASLEEVGFDVLLYLDTTSGEKEAIKSAIKEHLAAADIGVFFFAGHGMQYRGRNVLLPTDVTDYDPASLIPKSFLLDELTEMFADVSEGVRLFILDACRNNPFVQASEEYDEGLAYAEAGGGEVLIAYATTGGAIAYDGTRNSPYSAAIANALQESGLDIYDTFRLVRRTVRMATNGLQIPWVTGSVESRIVFRQPSEAPPVAVAVAAEPSSVDDLEIDRIFWYFLRDSRNPEDFDRFIAAFPASDFADEARERLAQTRATVIAQAEQRTRGVADAGTAAELVFQSASEFLFPQGGEIVVSDVLRRWPNALPSVANGLSGIVDECDVLAADPVDPQRVVPGVSWGLVNRRDALRACALALADDPENPRFLFQFGRVLDIYGKPDWAKPFYEEAGERGYSAALTNLGYNYRKGLGVEQSFERAFELYKRAADLGNLRARTNIGTAFIRGEGVPKSPEEGILWYRIAGSSGWANAINALGDVYLKGVGVEPDPVQAAALYGDAARIGQTDSMMRIGRAYLSGDGLEKDVAQGLSWLERSVALGNEYAPFHLARYLRDSSEPSDPVRRRVEDLLLISVERGYKQSHVALAEGYAAGAFGRPADLGRAYFHAVLAERGEQNGAGELVHTIGERLGEAERARAEEEAERFLRQNGY